MGPPGSGPPRPQGAENGWWKPRNPGVESKIKSGMVTVLNMILTTSELQAYGRAGPQDLGRKKRMIETPKIENPKIQNRVIGVPCPRVISIGMKISQVFYPYFFTKGE